MAKFEMDTEFIRKLAQILQETHLGEIELADGERRIRIARPTVTYAVAGAMAAPARAGRPAAPAAAAAGGRRSRQASRRGQVADGRHRLSLARARQARLRRSATR